MKLNFVARVVDKFLSLEGQSLRLCQSGWKVKREAVREGGQEGNKNPSEELVQDEMLPRCIRPHEATKSRSNSSEEAAKAVTQPCDGAHILGGRGVADQDQDTCECAASSDAADCHAR